VRCRGGPPGAPSTSEDRAVGRSTAVGERRQHAGIAAQAMGTPAKGPCAVERELDSQVREWLRVSQLYFADYCCGGLLTLRSVDPNALDGWTGCGRGEDSAHRGKQTYRQHPLPT
jgi:hypothetical protein